LRAGTVSRRDFLRTVTLLGVAAPAAYAAAGLVAGTGPAPAAMAQTPTRGGILRVAMPVRAIADPAKFEWTDQANITRHVLESLTVTGPDNITRPHLAERWEASDDLKTWTLFLRKGVTWNNGDAFTAEDVAANFRRWLDPQNDSPNLGLFEAMTSEAAAGETDDGGSPVTGVRLSPGAIEPLGDNAIRLHLNRAELAIPEYLAHYTAAIVHRSFDLRGGNFAGNSIGTGAYELITYEPGVTAFLAKRDAAAYWGREVHLDGIHYVDHSSTASAGLAALATDQVDLVHEVFIEQLDVLTNIPNVRLYEAVTAQTGVARMQVDRKPFTDRRVRTAVRLCQDHQKLLELAYRGKGAPAQDHHVAPIHPDYAEMDTPAQDYDRARALLAEAGYPDGIDLTLTVKQTPSWEVSTAQALANMCRPAGIRIALNVLPNEEYWPVWNTADFGFTAWTHRPLGVMALNIAYRSGAPWNESHYANPAFDRELDLASATLDVAERRKHMAVLQKMLQDDAVIAQPLWRSVFTAAKDRVRNFQLHPTLCHQFNDVWLA
jgi:peptide/nickel transport system substrate-binding protein